MNKLFWVHFADLKSIKLFGILLKEAEIVKSV